MVNFHWTKRRPYKQARVYLKNELITLIPVLSCQREWLWTHVLTCNRPHAHTLCTDDMSEFVRTNASLQSRASPYLLSPSVARSSERRPIAQSVHESRQVLSKSSFPTVRIPKIWCARLSCGIKSISKRSGPFSIYCIVLRETVNYLHYLRKK